MWLGLEAPLASTSQGFHTPVEDDDTRRFLPTPTSAILSRSLDGYLEPNRMSFGSPRAGSPGDDTFPVFSPPPGPTPHRRVPWLIGPWSVTPRHSIISSTKSHQTCKRLIKFTLQFTLYFRIFIYKVQF